jgi:hypothetical protein
MVIRFVNHAIFCVSGEMYLVKQEQRRLGNILGFDKIFLNSDFCELGY